jgi:hypothetical protein
MILLINKSNPICRPQYLQREKKKFKRIQINRKIVSKLRILLIEYMMKKIKMNVSMAGHIIW